MDASTVGQDESATFAQILDERAIWNCLVRYSRGVDRLDRELVLSAYHPDAIDDHGELVGSPEEFVAWAFALHSQGQVSTQHHLTNHTCDVNGDVAHAETYFLFTALNRDNTVWNAGGRYVDRLEKRGGEWKIAFRYCIVEWSQCNPAIPSTFAGVPDLLANGAPSRDRGDPSYRRPLGNTRARRFPTS